ARRRTGFPIHHGALCDLRLPAGSFDVITGFDVVEHVHDPRAFLKETARLLRPGGLLFLVTPNVSGWSRRLMGRFWFHFKPLEHTYYFDRRTLGRFLEEAGFETVEVRRNLRRVNLRFVCERMRSYSRALGRVLHPLAGRWSWSERLAFPLYTGEIEVLARKEAAPEA
ncbi:MAG: class I SAM-dependent methyltransferase, partial [Planctomycetota bacterium]